MRSSRAVWNLTKGQRHLYGGAAVALMVAALVGYLSPLVIMNTIDSVIGDKPMQAPQFVISAIESMGGTSTLVKNLWIAGLAVLVLTMITGFFTYLRGRWTAMASETICRDLRDRLYDHLQHLPVKFHDGAESGDVVQRCTSDVETIRLFLSVQAVEIVRASTLMLTALPIMAWLDWRMALAATAVLPVIVTFAVVFFNKVKVSFEAMDEAEGKLTARLQENLTGIRVVRAFARQEFECGRFAELNEDHRRKHMKLYTLMGVYWSMSDFLVFIQMGLVLFAGAYYVSLGEAAGGISVGTMVAFWSYVGLYIWPVRQMGRILADLGKAIVALGRVQVILDEPVEADADSPLPAKIDGRIEFNDVTFAHKEDLPVIRNVSFAIEPGESLAILGPSGSGKSTIINLLLRFYDYDSGSITIDSHELRELSREFVRGQIGVVLQEPFLFSKSLRENIGLGTHHSYDVTHATDDLLVEVASAACVHDAIMGFKDGYDTLIGEKGVTLSGGQRQRVAIARALLRESPILILDDAFSAVDTRTEKLILEDLKRRHGNQTTIVIAHRLSTLINADRVMVLDRDGGISQMGTHDELIESEGMYQRLWALQSAMGNETGTVPS